MKLGIMQPYLFPYLGYFQLINAVDKFILLDDVNYIKGGWINRNYLQLNNSIVSFTVPLKKPSSFKKINEISILPDVKWKNKFLKTIHQNYKKAKFYSSFAPILEKIILNDFDKISDLVYFSIVEINDYLNIKTDVISTSSIYNNQHLKGVHRIMDICKKEGAENYINSIGGRDIYDAYYFKQNNISLNFIKTRFREYNQNNSEFNPALSIIDILMFNSPGKVSEMLLDYELI